MQAFIEKLNQDTGRNYRLLTEAEWEYAARAGTTTPFNTGENLTTDQANYDGNYPFKNNSKGEFVGKITPVGTYPPNKWGLSDMHGNGVMIGMIVSITRIVLKIIQLVLRQALAV